VRKKINKLFAGLGLIRIVKNRDHDLEISALGLPPLAVFSRPQSQFFTLRTSQPANNKQIFTVFKIIFDFIYPISKQGFEVRQK